MRKSKKRFQAEQLECRFLLSATETGVFYNDLNANGTRDPGEPPLVGEQIALYSGDDGHQVAAQSTDANGVFTFSNLPAANYYLLPFYSTPGWRQSEPDNTGGLSYFVGDGQTHTENYGFTKIIPCPSLDTTFAATGTTTAGTNGDGGRAFVQQPNGNLVVIGDRRIYRFTPDGDTDNTFGQISGTSHTGFIGLGFPNNDVRPTDAVGQPDGKFAISALWYNNGTFQLAAIRYNADGTPDTSFGTGGVTHVDFGASVEFSSITRQADGKLILAGEIDGQPNKIALVRLLSNGTLDPSFGPPTSPGKSILTLSFYFAGTVKCAVDSQDRIVVAISGQGNNAFVTRALANGSIDNSFGSNGVVNVSPQGMDGSVCWAVTVQPDDKILTGGYGTPAIGMLVCRFNTDGTNDLTFGTNGAAVVRMYRHADGAFAGVAARRILLGPGGTIVAVGESGTTSDAGKDMMAARFLPNGQLDTTFGQGGTTSIAVSATGEFVCGGVVLPDGRVIIAGGTNSNLGSSTVMVARVYSTDPPQMHADPGAPYYLVPEGGSVMLDASNSTISTGPVARYEWDLNYNNFDFHVSTTGAKVTFNAAALDAPGFVHVGLRIWDNAGHAVTTSTDVIAQSVPPTATFSGGTIIVGNAGSVAFSNQFDPSAADRAAGFKYSYDFNNDGIFEITDSSSSKVTVPAKYLATTGAHTIHGRIKDKDGDHTDYTTKITVAPLASISGTVFADNNGNGKRDTGETAVSGRKIYIDKNKNGLLDTGEPTFTTGAAGTFTFAGLAAGTYRIRDVLPAGWRRTLPSAGYYDVTLTAGQTVTAKNFAETTRGLISGVVFKDTNANGIKDSTEAALSGWVLFLDTNNNGKLDSGELSFTTAADGKFSFVVPAGTYHLREVLKTGFKRTAPSTGVYNITISSGQSVTGKNFGDK